ncbi:hypothetical protein T484DRAFT_1756712 [Baffinella frigidus]|nr:hypothetical protein T484DRAFT_1756712 [Cryptophyta sp. CCMP2293]
MEFGLFAVAVRKNAAALLHLVQIAEKEVHCTTYRHMNADDYILFTTNEQIHGGICGHYAYRSLGHFFKLCITQEDKTIPYSEDCLDGLRTYCNSHVAKTVVLTKPIDAIQLIYKLYTAFQLGEHENASPDATQQMFAMFNAAAACMHVPSDNLTTNHSPAPEAVLLTNSQPDVAVPTAAVPDAAVPTAAVPAAAVPTAAVPGAAVPGAAVPGAAVPTAAVPGAAVPTAAVPDAAVPDAAVPDAAVPTAAVPDAAVPDAAVPTAAAPISVALVATGGGGERVASGLKKYSKPSFLKQLQIYDLYHAKTYASGKERAAAVKVLSIRFGASPSRIYACVNDATREAIFAENLDIIRRYRK